MSRFGGVLVWTCRIRARRGCGSGDGRPRAGYHRCPGRLGRGGKYGFWRESAGSGFMRVFKASGWRRVLAALVIIAGLIVAITTSASAAQPTITGTVEDTSGNPLASVTVNVQDPSTDSTVTSTTTASDGTFSASVNSGTYNVEFVAPSSTGLQSYLATGVAAGSAPLTIILKSSVVDQVEGTLSDTSGDAYGNSG